MTGGLMDKILVDYKIVKRAIFFILFFLWGAWGLSAQVISSVDTILFAGVIFDSGTGEQLSDVTCRLGEDKGTISDKNGYFRICLQKGDSVWFTYVGYRPCLVVVPDSLNAEEYMIGVFMSPDTLELSEALIIRRWGENKMQYIANARNNMKGILKQAYNPNRTMDADMNQRMVINEYARSVEMKGHVDVRLGVGTNSLDAYKLLRLQKKLQVSRDVLNIQEIGLLKKIYYLEKRRK